MSERSLNFFVPEKRLEIPSDNCSSEVLLGLLYDSGYQEAPISAAPRYTEDFPYLPEWKPWRDRTGGTVHLHDRDLGKEVPLPSTTNGQLVSPPNIDGSPFFNGQKQILTYSVRLTPNILGVFWGVSSDPISELIQDLENVAIVGLRTNQRGLINFFDWRFSSV